MPFFPDAWFSDGVIFFGKSLSRESFISKGFYVDLPDVAQSSESQMEELQDQARMLLAMIDDDMALQVQWTVDSDYRQPLDAYRRETHGRAGNAWSRFVREERFLSINEQMLGGVLRRERLAMFFSRKCDSMPRRGFFAASEIDAFMAQQSKSLSDKIGVVQMLMPDAKVVEMDDQEHYFYARQFFNPSMDRVSVPLERRYDGFDPSLTMLEQCLGSDGVALDLDECVAFKMDGNFHVFLVVRRWPRQTYPGIIKQLTGSVGKNICVTQNIYPLSISEEIRKEEKLRERLEGDARHTGRYSLYTSIARKETKIHSLMQGYTLPYHVLTVVRVWDRSVDGTLARAAAAKTALQNMAGAQYHQCNHGAQARNILLETVPGWLGGKTREWDIYAENQYLPDLLPLSSTFAGELDTAEAIYDGGNGNVVGVKTFSGHTPQHALIVGMRGSGKSMLAADLLSQTECYYDYTAIVEEGLSYGTYTRTLGAHPIIISPNGDQTLNYFDTLGSPLSSSVVTTASALCLQMAGASQSEDVNNHRSALLTEYIQQLFWDTYEDWKSEHEEAHEDVCRLAFGLREMLPGMPPGSNFLDAYGAWRDRQEQNPDEAVAWLNSHPESQILAFAKDPQNSVDVRNLAMALLGHGDFPTHQSLVEILRYGRMGHHKAEETNMLATMLSQWTRNEGSQGNLFDGPTNILLGQKIDHFELGYIPEAARQLRAAAGFLIANMVRQFIMGAPRAQRKRVVFEEVSRFLNIPGADKTVSEYYAQMRKYGAWVLTITQQVEQLTQTPLWPVIKGNCTEFFFLRQNNRPTVDMLMAEVGLPDRAAEAVLQFPLPEHMPKGQRKFSSAIYMKLTDRGPMCGAIRNYASREMIYMASSDAETFDRRQKDLAGYTDVTEGIFEICDQEGSNGAASMNA